MKKGWAILKGTFKEFNEDNVLRLSAALAYYAVFSIGPLLVIVVGLAGLAFGHEKVRHQVEQQLQVMVGEKSSAGSGARQEQRGEASVQNTEGEKSSPEGSNPEKPAAVSGVIESMMKAQHHGKSLMTTIVGIVALFFGAAGVFGQLQDSLNTIWEVKSKPGGGILGFVRTRFLSFAMVLGIGFLLLVSLALTTFLSAMTGSLGHMLPASETILHGLNFVISFAVITALFAMIFKVLPDVRVPFKKVWVGAIATALLFTIGKYLLALYLGRESTRSPYGAAGSVIVILMWVYYASLILFFGAEFTQVYVKATSKNVEPNKYAVPVIEEERAEEGIPHEQGGQQAPVRKGPRLPPRATPGVVVRADPVGFLTLMLVSGFVGGALLSFKTIRKGLRLYATFAR